MVRVVLVNGDVAPDNGVCGPQRRPKSPYARLVWQAIGPQGDFIAVFAAAGLNKPDTSIVDDSFLASVRDMPQMNLAVELLRKLLADEVRARAQVLRPEPVVRRHAGRRHPPPTEPGRGDGGDHRGVERHGTGPEGGVGTRSDS